VRRRAARAGAAAAAPPRPRARACEPSLRPASLRDHPDGCGSRPSRAAPDATHDRRATDRGQSRVVETPHEGAPGTAHETRQENVQRHTLSTAPHNSALRHSRDTTHSHTATETQRHRDQTRVPSGLGVGPMPVALELPLSTLCRSITPVCSHRRFQHTARTPFCSPMHTADAEHSAQRVWNPLKASP
jgi:hypothetical protein